MDVAQEMSIPTIAVVPSIVASLNLNLARQSENRGCLAITSNTCQ